nr:PREDICTED: phospholipase A2 inhibitor isoform X1 [Tribolium castaneum]|eukprot:XP_008200854.1 PREDICTED: phospholipase A2 inhibitor isoform X1 [Tribolium castaneum]
MFGKIISVSLCLALCVVSGTCKDFDFQTNGLFFEVDFREGLYGMLGYSRADNMTAGIIANIEDVKILDLKDNSIQEIQSGAFQNLPKLKIILLKYNDLTKIRAGTFSTVPSVTYLDLGDNNISYVDPHAFDNLTRLYSLGLDNNKLVDIDSHWFEDKPDLKNIYVTGNLIKKISADQFASLKGRKSVSLYLGDNPVETIEDDAFKGFEDLSVLSLENITLTNFTGKFLKDLKIKTLELNRNKIKCVAEEDFENVFVAKTTEIMDNPLDPDCLNKIQLWAQKHNKTVVTECCRRLSKTAHSQ